MVAHAATLKLSGKWRSSRPSITRAESESELTPIFGQNPDDRDTHRDRLVGQSAQDDRQRHMTLLPDLACGSQSNERPADAVGDQSRAGENEKGVGCLTRAPTLEFTGLLNTSG